MVPGEAKKKKVFNRQKNFVNGTTDVTARSSAYEAEIVGQERRGTGKCKRDKRRKGEDIEGGQQSSPRNGRE